MEQRQLLPPGTIVYGADGENLGTVQSSEASHIVVESGDSSSTFYVPATAIVETREDGAYLSVTATDARNQGWDHDPVDGEDGGELLDSGSGYSAVQGEDSLDEDRATMPGQNSSPNSPPRLARPASDLDRPSGIPGPDATG